MTNATNIKLHTCDADGCDRVGIWNPEILIDHEGPKVIQNPLRVPMKINFGKADERPLRVCLQHTRAPIQAYVHAIDYGFLREVECGGVLFDIQKDVRHVGLQFSGLHDNDLIPHPDKVSVFAGKTVRDGGLVI